MISSYFNSNERTEVNRNWAHGVGMGTEFMFAKHIAINFMIGYAGYENFDRINMTIETGIYFKL